MISDIVLVAVSYFLFLFLENTGMPNLGCVKDLNSKFLSHPKCFIILFCLASILCFLGNITSLAGLMTFNIAMLLLTGKGDVRYVIKKFLIFHLMAISLLWFGMHGQDVVDSMMVVLGIGMLLASYPICGWVETFSLRASFPLLIFWALVNRSYLVSFALNIFKLDGFQWTNGSRIVVNILIYSSLFFVPVLFFAKRSVRRIISVLLTWQSGYFWLFLFNISDEKFCHAVLLMSIVQGIFTAMILCGMSRAVHLQSLDNVECMKNLQQKDFLGYSLLMTGLLFLPIVPLVFLGKSGMSVFSNVAIAIMLMSAVLPYLFNYRLCNMISGSRN